MSRDDAGSVKRASAVPLDVVVIGFLGAPVLVACLFWVASHLPWLIPAKAVSAAVTATLLAIAGLTTLVMTYKAHRLSTKDSERDSAAFDFQLLKDVRAMLEEQIASGWRKDSASAAWTQAGVTACTAERNKKSKVLAKLEFYNYLEMRVGGVVESCLTDPCPVPNCSRVAEGDHWHEGLSETFESALRAVDGAIEDLRKGPRHDEEPGDLWKASLRTCRRDLTVPALPHVGILMDGAKIDPSRNGGNGDVADGRVVHDAANSRHGTPEWHISDCEVTSGTLALNVCRGRTLTLTTWKIDARVLACGTDQGCPGRR